MRYAAASIGGERGGRVCAATFYASVLVNASSGELVAYLSAGGDGSRYLAATTRDGHGDFIPACCGAADAVFHAQRFGIYEDIDMTTSPCASDEIGLWSNET